MVAPATPIPSLTGGAGGSAGPSSAEGASYGSGADNSGWVINFSGVQSASAAQDKSGGASGLGTSGIAGAVPWWVWAGLGLVVVWRMRASAK